MKKIKKKETIDDFKYRITRHNFLHGLTQKDDEVKEDKED